MESGNCDPLSAAKLQLIAINLYRHRSAAPFCGLVVIGGGTSRDVANDLRSDRPYGENVLPIYNNNDIGHSC